MDSNSKTNQIYNNRVYSEANQKYRWIDQAVFEVYLKEISKNVRLNSVTDVLDIGCGTGQFAINLARTLPNATIVALDSSTTQLAQMQSNLNALELNNIFSVYSTFEKYTTDTRFDIIVCSEAIHLFDDLSLFAKRINELLKPQGVICIRTPSPLQYSQRSIYSFFPRCRYINLLRCKGPELIESAFSLYNMKILCAKEVNETKVFSSQELLAAFHAKMFSTLHLIPEHEFQDGMEKMEQALKTKKTYIYDFFMTAYIIGRK
jgi:2-polyprenyl-3-methyl-5-hydroxy-6-metoxy-1,4-benzoquinol methylase